MSNNSYRVIVDTRDHFVQLLEFGSLKPGRVGVIMAGLGDFRNTRDRRATLFEEVFDGLEGSLTVGLPEERQQESFQLVQFVLYRLKAGYHGSPFF